MSRGEREAVGQQLAGVGGGELVGPLVEVHAGVQAAGLLELGLVGRGSAATRVARAGGGGEEAERVEVRAADGCASTTASVPAGTEPQRDGGVPGLVGRGRPSPTRAARSSPAAAGATRSRRAGRGRTGGVAAVGRAARPGRGATVPSASAARARARRGRVGVAQRDPGPRVPLLEPGGPVRVVGEQEVEHGVRLTAAAALAVGERPPLDPPAVCGGPRTPDGPVEHHRHEPRRCRRAGAPYSSLIR